MTAPPVWATAELVRGAAESSDLFRRERIEEPLEAYLEQFERFRGDVEELLKHIADLTKLEPVALDVLTDSALLHAFRYLAGPPISTDDLKTVAEAPSLNPVRLRADQDLVQRIVQVIVGGLDRHRFPWVSEGREPTDGEKHAAIIASAALMAAQRVATVRRNEGKAAQERRVEAALLGLGFVAVAKRRVATFAQAPQPGEFCGESVLGARKADFIVGLWDSRVMPLECKVSNSAINSVKRLNNDAAAKADAWRQDFGQRQIVAAAVLSGVYKLSNLEDAQGRGLTPFWAHELDRLTEWIDRAR